VIGAAILTVVVLFLIWPAVAAVVIGIDRETYVVGSSITVSYVTPADEEAPVYQVGLYRHGEAVLHEYRDLLEKGRGSVTFTAPAEPGAFAFRVLHNDTLLAQTAFTTVVPPTPGAIKIAGDRFAVRSTISVTVDLLPDRAYPNPWVGLFAPNRPARGGGFITESRIAWQSVGKDALVFDVPAEPGEYELRLYDRDSNRFLLDTRRFTAFVPPVPGALSMDSSERVVGEKLTLTVTLPADRTFDGAWVGLFEPRYPVKGGAVVDERRIAWQGVGQEPLVFMAPEEPGKYEFRLYDRNANPYLLDVLSFRVQVPLAPNALALDKKIYLVGETITLTVALPANHYYGGPWVGMFAPRRVVKGGAEVAAERLVWQLVGQEPLVFTAPADPGEYTFELFDRNPWRYRLATVSFKVIVPPTPGALVVDKRQAIVGEPLTVTVKLAPNRHDGGAWVGMFAPAETVTGGATTTDHRIAWGPVGKEPLAFTAPEHPGRYEFRLHDRNMQYYVLDTVAFAVTAPPTPQALKIDKPHYVIGEAITLTVDLQPGRYYGGAWVGMFVPGGNAAGGAVRDSDRIAWERVEKASLAFIAPEHPGDYEFRLYDRDARHYRLDALPFKVVAPPVSGSLSLSTTESDPGGTITVTVNLPAGRYYAAPWVGLFRKEHSVDGGAVVDAQRLTWQRLGKESLVFEAPGEAGDYEFRLYDRDAWHYWLADAGFRVRAAARPASADNMSAVAKSGARLSLRRDWVTVGATVEVAFVTPTDEASPLLSVGLFQADDHRELTSQRVPQKGRGTMTFTAPDVPGTYEFRLFYEREYYATAAFRTVVPLQPDGLRLDGTGPFTVGETLRVQVRMPENRTFNTSYPNAWVGLFRVPRTVEGGAKVDAEMLALQNLGQRQADLTFTAPTDPGAYEFRLYDRGESFYRLASVAFRVEVPPAAGALTLAGRRVFGIGESIALKVQVPGNRHLSTPYPRAWVGLFRSQYAAVGGSEVEAEQLAAQDLTQPETGLVFTAPDRPGTYEFRLYDRAGPYYRLATVGFAVEVPPAPESLTIREKTLFTIGETILLAVAVPPDRYLQTAYPHAWVEMFRAGWKADGGAQVESLQIARQDVQERTAQLTFPAPEQPGTYGFRLFDRAGHYYVLAETAFEVEVPPLPAALDIGTKRLFTVGEPVTVKVAVPANRYFRTDYPRGRVVLARSGFTATGGATATVEEIAVLDVQERQMELHFTAPEVPGNYAFQLFDRAGPGYLLATLPVDVEVPPQPGALALLEPRCLVTGEPFTVNVAIPARRYFRTDYPPAWVGLFAAAHAVDGGAQTDVTQLDSQSVKARETALTFTAPSRPGRFALRLYDRDGSFYLLDELPIEVIAPPLPDTLSVTGNRFAAGSPLPVTVAVPENRYLQTSYPFARVDLVRSRYRVAGGATVDAGHIDSREVMERDSQLAFTTPNAPGIYELRFFDRDGPGYLLATRVVRVDNPGQQSAEVDTVVAEPLHILADFSRPGALPESDACQSDLARRFPEELEHPAGPTDVAAAIYFVRAAGEGFRSIADQLIYGQPFLVEVRFTAAPPADRYLVKLEGEGGGTRLVGVERTGNDPQVYRSALLRVEPAPMAVHASDTPNAVNRKREE
jgi:hypothetical protein